nr:MAG TPA: hypothetical protein [Caudoviricetes sp.]DAH62573.1 MAG TPA: hypothetical protein [Caudoviricetes sp.]
MEEWCERLPTHMAHDFHMSSIYNSNYLQSKQKQSSHSWLYIYSLFKFHHNTKRSHFIRNDFS